MLEKVKQMLGALLGACGTGDMIDAVNLQSEYGDAGEGATMLTMSVQVQFKVEEAEHGSKGYTPARDGEVH